MAPTPKVAAGFIPARKGLDAEGGKTEGEKVGSCEDEKVGAILNADFGIRIAD
jgi:hypothetical protein